MSYSNCWYIFSDNCLNGKGCSNCPRYHVFISFSETPVQLQLATAQYVAPALKFLSERRQRCLGCYVLFMDEECRVTIDKAMP